MEITGRNSTGRWRVTKCHYYYTGLNDIQHSLTITWLDLRYTTQQNRPRNMKTVAKIPLIAMSKLLLSLHEFSWKVLLLSGISSRSSTENFAVVWIINLWDKSSNFIWHTVKLLSGSYCHSSTSSFTLISRHYTDIKNSYGTVCYNIWLFNYSSAFHHHSSGYFSWKFSLR